MVRSSGILTSGIPEASATCRIVVVSPGCSVYSLLSVERRPRRRGSRQPHRHLPTPRASSCRETTSYKELIGKLAARATDVLHMVLHIWLLERSHAPDMTLDSRRAIITSAAHRQSSTPLALLETQRRSARTTYQSRAGRTGVARMPWGHRGREGVKTAK